MPADIQQQFAFGAMQNFHQIANGLFPNVERMLARAAGTNELAIARKTALLPGGSASKF